MTSEPPNPHDAFFKQYLGQPNVALDFFRHHLPAEIVRLLDLSQLQLEKDSYVDEKLRSYFSDLVYSTMTTAQTPVRVALLSEHKSYPDEWVDFQALRYQMGYWVREFEQFEAEKAARKKEDEAWAKSEPKPVRESRPPLRQTITPILVLLVYHGKEEWKVSLRFARHFTGMEDPNSPLSLALGRYVPDFEPHFINFSAMADEEIQGEVFTRLFVLVMKYIFANGRASGRNFADGG